jgi:hypothetical protein
MEVRCGESHVNMGSQKLCNKKYMGAFRSSLLFGYALVLLTIGVQGQTIRIKPGDNTKIISGAILDPKINTILVDTNNIRLNGTINFFGKVLKVEQGATITGTYTLQNAVIDAGYQQKIFSADAAIVNATVTGSMVSVRWFGATGDGVTDDYEAIQRAIDAVIQNKLLPRDLYFPKGIYKISRPLFASNWNGYDYQFFSLNLIGESNTHFTSSEYNTRIVYSGNEFAIGYQRARSSEIRGLSIEGIFNPQFGGYANQFRVTYNSFANGVRDTRHSPLTGIAVDPVENGSGTEYTQISDRYPSMLDKYRGSGTRGGSSAVNVKECRIFGFTVGIGYSLNGATLNAENCHAEKVAIDVCKAAFAYGQAQIKDNYIRNSIHWDRVHTVIDCVTYGSVSGLRPTPPYIDGMNIAGGINRIFNINGANFSWSAKNIFAELIYSIGTVKGGTQFSIEDSEFNFPEDAVGVSPDFHIDATNGYFKSCSFKVYDDEYSKRLILRGDRISFQNCRFDRPPLEQLPLREKHRVDYRNCFTGTGYDFGWEHNNTATGTYHFESLRTRGRTVYDMGAGTQFMPLYSSMVIEFESTKMDDVILPSRNYVALTKIGDNIHFKLEPWESLSLKIDDYICEQENTFPKFYYETGEHNKFPVYGRVTYINYNTGEVILSNVPGNTTSTQQAYIYASREVINHLPYESGGIIYNPCGATIIITNNTNTPLIGDAVDAYTGHIIRGTKWKHQDRTFICTKSGYLNGTNKAIWREVD